MCSLTQDFFFVVYNLGWCNVDKNLGGNSVPRSLWVLQHGIGHFLPSDGVVLALTTDIINVGLVDITDSDLVGNPSSKCLIESIFIGPLKTCGLICLFLGLLIIFFLLFGGLLISSFLSLKLFILFLLCLLEEITCFTCVLDGSFKSVRSSICLLYTSDAADE